MIFYLLLGVVLAGALFLFLSWWAHAEVSSAKRGLFWSAILISLLLSALLLATGRSFFAIVPLIYTAWRFMQGMNGRPVFHKAQGSMTRREALEVLGLEEGATHQEINSAYRLLMAKCHPDKGGSDWMASKLSEARSILLKE